MLNIRLSPRFIFQIPHSILVLLLPLLFLLALPTGVQAQFSYTTNNGVITITKYTGPGGPVIIPGTTNGLPVTSIGDGAFYSCSTLTAVTIPSTVTNIGDSAFLYCGGLTNITIPNSVITVAPYAFYNCLHLTGVTIGTNVASIGDNAFEYCGLTNVAIPSSVTSIGAYALSGCTRLNAITVDIMNPVYSSLAGVLFNLNQTTLIQCPGGKAGGYAIPNSVINIGDSALFYCTSLTGVTIGTNVSNIGSFALSYCTSLTNITVPNNVTTIGSYAFHVCTSLTNVTIGTNVTSIGYAAFSDCTSLSAIAVDALNPVYSSLAGVLFNKSQTTLLVYPAGKSGGYTIRNTVTNVGSYAFQSCVKLTTVTISDSVASVGDNAFNSCTSLTNVTIGTNVTSIGYAAFSDCTSLSGIVVDALNPVYSSLAGVLFNQSHTVLLQYPAGKTGGYTVPSTVTNIGTYAFDSCRNLTSVTLPNAVITIGDYAFEYCGSLTNVTMGDALTSIGFWAFEDCYSLTSITVPNTVTDIGGGAFLDCSALTNVTIGNRVTSIGGAAFNGCIGLTDVTIPSSVTSIGDYAFYYCTSLMGIYFQGNAPIAGGLYVFQGDNNATAYYLPGASGWGSTFAGRPAVLWNPIAQTTSPNFGIRTNRFGFSITGTANIPIVVEACTNLTHPVWLLLQTCTLSNGSIYFSDPAWTNHSTRIYRIRSP